MDALFFDCLAQSLAVTGSRRGLLHLLTAVPLGASLTTLLSPLSGDEADAAKRRRHRIRRHSRRRDQVQDERKRKKKKKPCAQAGQVPKRRTSCCSGLLEDAAGACVPPAPASCAATCSGCCNGESCQAGASSAACGRNGAPCAACANPTPTCADQICAACTASAQCPAGTVCHEGVCQACDVCARGCYYANVLQAVSDSGGPATIRICPGAYVAHLTIGRDVHLIGAGHGGGAGDTILTGTGSGRVVTIIPGLRVTLERLRITGGAGNADGGGIHTTGSQVTLKDCTVTGNSGVFGGAINNGGWLTLDHSEVTLNDATFHGGGIYNNVNSTVILINGSRISRNTAYPQGNSGGGIFNNGLVDAAGGAISGNVPDDCVDFVFGTGCPP